LNTATVTEKSRYPKVEVTWPVVVLTAHGALVAETKNISANGAFLFCSAPLHPKEKLKLFIMAPNRNSLHVSAEVSWSNAHDTELDTTQGGVGIRFTTISAADRRFLRNIITEHYAKKTNL
jgi:hypothetical protein